MLQLHKSTTSWMTYFLLFLITFFQHQNVFAKLTLANGSYSNRTHVDSALRTTNLNFVYEGCDQNPDPSKISLQTDGSCKDAQNYFLERQGNQSTISGTVGEIIAKYNEDSSATCTNPVRVELGSNFSLQNIYSQFESQNCYPTHLVIRDSDQEAHSRIVKETKNKGLCNLKDVHITKDGFPTEELGILNMKANDDGFKIGDETQYRYDQSKGWCIQYKSNEEKCGQWPTPVPIAYRDTATGTTHVKAVVNLTNDGKATIQALNKSYANNQEMYNDLKNGGGSQVDSSKGRIEFHTWTKNNGMKRAIVRSYDGQGQHQRSINLFARNIFGSEVTKQWCTGEHCFYDVEQPPLKQHQCKDTPAVDMDNGGSGNLCYSCIGVTPGLCAIRADDVAQVKENLGEGDGFTMTQYGEYNMYRGVSTALRKKFAQMLSKPERPGCFPGNAEENRNTFEPATDEYTETTEVRTVNSLKKKKPKKSKNIESL